MDVVFEKDWQNALKKIQTVFGDNIDLQGACLLLECMN